jgi:hypothetical protein
MFSLQVLEDVSSVLRLSIKKKHGDHPHENKTKQQNIICRRDRHDHFQYD